MSKIDSMMIWAAFYKKSCYLFRWINYMFVVKFYGEINF